MFSKSLHPAYVQDTFDGDPWLEIRNEPDEYVYLANAIDWAAIERIVELCFKKGKKAGRPSKFARLIVGILIIQYMENLSDREAIKRCSRDQAYQYFCGLPNKAIKRPCAPSTLSRWRKRLGEKVWAEILSLSVGLAVELGILDKKNLETVVVDTTAQKQNIKQPSTANLLDDMHRVLLRQAKRLDIPLRRNYRTVMKRWKQEHIDLARSKKKQQAKEMLEHMKGALQEVLKDIEASPKRNDKVLAQKLELAHQILLQCEGGKKTIYSVHQPHVAAIVKNDTCTYGSKVGIVTTAENPFVIGIAVFMDNCYDGHTLDDSLKATLKITGIVPKTAACDYGYRGGKTELPTVIYCFNRKHAVPEELRALKRRRPSIEPIIGHLKSDHSLGLNRLSGKEGCIINALRAAIGFNFRKIAKALVRRARLFFVFSPFRHHASTSFSTDTLTPLCA